MILQTFETTDIPDAWFQCVYRLIDVGFRYQVQKGSFEGEERLEFDWVTILVKHPYNEPYHLMLPKIPSSYGIPDPVEPNYVEQYLPYLLTPYISSDEQYTYGSRIHEQIGYWVKELSKGSNTNQAVLQVAQPEDYKLDDPPCLRHIDMRVKDGELIFYPYFRSWDLWAGFPANLAAIAVLQKMMADDIGVTNGPIYASSKGLHIYGYIEELARLRTCKTS